MFSSLDTCISDVLGQGYRSPSPPLTDSHEGLLDMDESSGGISEEDQCVIAGGMREGWGPASSVVLWRRMLGVLGNINKISNPAIHAKVIECLATVWNMLAKVHNCSSICMGQSYCFLLFVFWWILGFYIKGVQERTVTCDQNPNSPLEFKELRGGVLNGLFNCLKGFLLTVITVCCKIVWPPLMLCQAKAILIMSLYVDS